MTTYVVKVKNASGKTLTEKVEAASPQEARGILRTRYPAVGKAKPAAFWEGDLSDIKILSFLNSVTVKDKAVFSRQFAVLVNAGVAIVRSLAVLAEQCSNPKLKKALLATSSDIQQGVSLSEAFAKHPDCFDQLYVSMVEAGETGGVLDEVLNRLARLLEDMARLKNQIKSAMTYPVAIALFTFAVFIGMTVFLVPIFAGIFEDLGVELPALTRLMLFLSGVLRSTKVIIPIVAIAISAFLLRRYYKTPAGRVQIDGLMLKLPLLGDLNQKSAVARFCRVFGSLTRSGVPILNCLDIVGDTVGNQVIANAVSAIKAEIQQGGVISIALQKQKVFPALAIQMIGIGEETGELDAMVMKVADFYEDEVEQTVKALTSLIEPIMIVLVAVMVGTILVSMYLPLLTVFNELG
ncbi:MAG: type II secretion system F family protein [Cyanophyceae cyanobacterium]